MGAGEIELKLILAPGDGDRLARLRRHFGAGPVRLREQHLTTTYFDTSDRSLAAAGVAVRVRRIGRQRIQTIKAAGSQGGGLFQRPEWETVIHSDRPVAEPIIATGLSELSAKGLVDRLEPVFSTIVRRRTCLIGAADWEAELAIDDGEVVAGMRSSPINEAELELRRGHAGHLFSAALSIADHLPIRLTTESKSDRGHALACGAAIRPVKSKPLTLKPRQSIASAFQAIARNCLHQVLANQPALLEQGDPEAVHQMRVALRRLRSAIKVFAPVLPPPGLGTLSAELRWLLGHLGPARDGDVFLSEILAPVVAEHPHEKSLRTVDLYWRECRDRDFAAAKLAVADPRFPLLLLRLGEWIETLDWPAAAGKGIAPFARRILRRRLRRLKRAAGRSLIALTPEERHQVRILGKQLRYAGDFMASLFPAEPARAFLESLAQLQDLLGHLNDIAVAVPKLCAAHQSGRSAWAAGLVAGWHESRRPLLLDQAETAWKRLRKMDGFWE